MRTAHEVDFLPERIRQHRARRRRLLRQGYCLAVYVAAICALGYTRQARIATAKGELARLEERAGLVEREAATIPKLRSQMSDLLIKKRIDEELGSRADCTAVLAELCRLLPENMALVSLEMRPVTLQVDASGPVRQPSNRAGASGADASRGQSKGLVRRAQVVLVGLAPSDVDVANFIGQLAASCLFEDVNMSYAKTVVFQGRLAREFLATCYLIK